VELRRLGRTGHRSSVAILGGAAFWDSAPEVAASAFDDALAAGVNHLDVAPQYGRAQEVLGPSIPAVRDRLFVACKTLRHNREGVRAQLEESLRLLNCDHFDLYQLHAVTDLEELDARTGAVEAIMAARDEGLCRWVGITGHNLTAPAAHLEALRRYDLDTVMFPVNPQLWSDTAYRNDAEALLAHAAEHDVGVMAIKAAAARPWAGRPQSSATWYEPYTADEEVARGVDFALSTPGVQAFCTPGDLSVLPTAVRAAGAHRPMDAGQREAAVASVAHEPSIFPMPAA
jgi:aryl-alcohol dehydrogenase-like predicted oxidoreductase